MIHRSLEKAVINRFNKGKLILIVGPRQVGKTTLAEMISKKSGLPTLWMNGDEPDIRDLLSNATSTRLKTIAGNNKLIIIDEAQRILNIGMTLKLMADNFEGVQVVVTGSSALELADELKEPLTGRKYEYFLYPLSTREMIDHTSRLEETRLLEHRLIFGYYPEIVSKPGEEKELLGLLSSSYLYKDLLSWQKIKKPVQLEKLVQALALQLGNQVSYRELGQLIGADNQTVERYVDLLEKAFIVFRLNPLSRNLRNELKKSRKIYFYDNGIRNAIIKNFTPLALRSDRGALWENFIISERMKTNQHIGRMVNRYFWRTRAQQEIDYVEEYEGKLFAYEIKWNPNKKPRFPQTFLKAYPETETHLVSPENYLDFVLN